MRTIFSRLFLFTIILILCNSWGFLVHRTVNQLAIYKLPGSMQSFFYSNREYLVKNAPRPDQRRNEDSLEASRHFIDLEAYGDSAAWKMPMKWEDAVRIQSKDSLLKYGFVPYHIVIMKNKLTEAFRSGNKDSILFYATDLAHYIADANVPLHTSINYDGQLTNQKGLHSLWESMIPEIELDKYTLYSSRRAKYISDPAKKAWETVRQSYLLLPGVFGEETEASKQFVDSTKFRVQTRRGREVKSYSSEFAKAYSARLGKTINDQLLHTAEDIADFWYTAWVDAGSPDLSNLLSKPFEKKEKKELKNELKAYRKNELLEKKLLIAREQQD